MAPPRYPGILWWLATAFAVVSLAFIAATFVAARETKAIELDARALQANALPSVEHLVEGRTLLRRSEATAARLSVEPSRSVADDLLDEVTTDRRDLHFEVGEYQSLPGFPGEREAYVARVKPALDEFDAAADRFAVAVRGASARGARTRAYEDLSGAIEALDRGLASVVELNALRARELTAHIISARRSSTLLAAGLDGAAAIVALLAAALVIAAAKRYERQREHDAEQLRARVHELDTVALRVAHDVLSPLSAVGLSLAALGREHGDDVSRRAIARAQRALIRSRDVATGIYEFARSGAAPMAGSRAPLRATIDAVIEDVLGGEGEAERRVQIDVEPFEDCDVRCEPGVLYSIVCNVLANAVKFTREAAVRRVTIRACPAGDRVRVEVRDSGPGIPAGLEEAIFEPYVRAPGVTQPGLGLGLATVKRYATSYGGSVGARRADGGSVVWFELPRAPGPPSAQPETPVPPAPPEGAAEQPPSVH